MSFKEVFTAFPLVELKRLRLRSMQPSDAERYLGWFSEKDGSILNIEVQIADLHNIDKRTLFYWAKLYQGQLQTGQQYNELARVITINVLGFSFLPDSEKYHSLFSLYDVTTGYRLNKDLEIHFLELPKWRRLNVTPKTRLNKWLTYLANSSPAEMEEIAMNEPAIKKALMLEEVFFKQDQERYLYEMREKALLDQISAIGSAKAEGKADVAKKMLMRGMSVEDIAELTGLSVADIAKLNHYYLTR